MDCPNHCDMINVLKMAVKQASIGERQEQRVRVQELRCHGLLQYTVNIKRHRLFLRTNDTCTSREGKTITSDYETEMLKM